MNPCITALLRIMDTLTNKSDIEIGNGKRKKIGPNAFAGIVRLIAMTILLAILAGLFSAPMALASKARLNDIIVTNTRDDLLDLPERGRGVPSENERGHFERRTVNIFIFYLSVSKSFFLVR